MVRPATRLWLARHGSTSWNEDGRLVGWADPALSPHGRAQARALGAALTGLVVDSVWTSDLRRAVETTTIALRTAGSGRVANVDARLRELRFGAIDGSRWTDLPLSIRRGLLGFEGFRAPSGESVEELRSRVWAVIDTLTPGDHLLVTHGGVIRLLLRDASRDAAIPAGSMIRLTVRRAT
jgi:2,3-bisphosphoglycerate-dependent phosphoglycerate mutase